MDASEKVRERFNELLVDIVVTDWTQVNGAGVVRVTQENGVRNIVIMNGGLIEQEEDKQLMESGISIIKKPFDHTDLIEAVHKKAAVMTENPKN